MADFDEAIRLDPVARPFRFHDRGNALRDAGQYDRALIDYDTAANLAPTDAWNLLDRGRTYTKIGRFDAAKNDFNAAIALDPSNAELRRYIAVELASVTSPSPSIPPSPQPPGPPRPTPGVKPDLGGPGPSPAETPEACKKFPMLCR
jgi:tetratricopeptide (TPR) repeat protein